MGIKFYQSASVTAGSQFQGTEFSAVPSKPATQRLQVREIHLRMGAEAKTWSIIKKFTVSGITVESLIRSATDTTSSLVLAGDDADFALLNGEQIQIKTTGATSAMQARIVYEEVDNSDALGSAG